MHILIIAAQLTFQTPQILQQIRSEVLNCTLSSYS
jgi:hypothetical protein